MRSSLLIGFSRFCVQRLCEVTDTKKPPFSPKTLGRERKGAAHSARGLCRQYTTQSFGFFADAISRSGDDACILLTKQEKVEDVCPVLIVSQMSKADICCRLPRQ